MFFLLSGEHYPLPRMELESCLAADGVRWQEAGSLGRVALLDLDGPPPTRMGLTPEIGELACTADDAEGLIAAVTDSPLELAGSFVVRASTVPKAFDCGATRLEPRLGDVIGERTGAPVDLHDPDTVLRVIATPEGAVMGPRVHQRGTFDDRKSDRRPYFHPSSLAPKLARAMVNLSGARSQKTLLDPFCGTGGIPIEAAMVGCRVLASDIDPKMVAGTKANLDHLDLEASMATGDARHVTELFGEGSVDCIATDPPYGRAASTWGVGLKDLFSEVFPALFAVLRPGGLMCMGAPQQVPLETLCRDVGFKYLQGVRIRVHGSLTRHICVAERP
ncbi:MAG: RsmD family RNA methyltransferase [Candidatus Undinarchaeales archaeon]|nr:RsmD family RNA methyltransferase [Candidatus Undinarchaeales archaeon]MDP7492253.1 RsmD family RNA methyltransferase [Candidatus Undinarchaeales archaeon]